jgi:multiple sugar transport system substrate-binding protein
MPNDDEPATGAAAMSAEELISLLDLLERVRVPTEKWFESIQPDAVWNMIVYLMRRHFAGKLVTPTSLARAADVPHATAVRRINDMLSAGLLVRRPRTKSGRSDAMHPSPELIRRAFACAYEVKTSIARSLGRNVDDASSFYLGASHLSASIIPPPAPLDARARFGGALRIALYDDPSFSITGNLQEEVAGLMDGRVSFQAFPMDELRRQILADAAQPISAYDMVQVNLPWIGEFSENEVLLPLDDLIEASNVNRADFHPAEWEGARNRGQQRAIPLHTAPQVLFCRRDMFEAVGVELPSTTDQVLAVARKLHVPKEGVFGVAWNGAAKTPVGQSYIQFLADFGQPILNLRPVPGGYDATHVEGEEYRPLVTSHRSRLTAEFMMELLEVSPPDVLDLTLGEASVVFGSGKAAMAYEFANRAARFEFDDNSPARGNVSYLPHPIGARDSRRKRRKHVSPIGGLVLGIPSNIDPRRREFAWRSLLWLTSPEVIKLLVTRGGIVSPRFSVAADPEVRTLSPVIAAVDEMAKRGELRLWPRPPVAEYQKIIDVLGEEIHAMLRRDKTIKAALSAAQNRIDKMMRDAKRY